MKIKSNYLSFILDLFILVLLTSCYSQKYPKGSIENEIVKELRNKNIHFKVDSIYIIDSLDTRSYSDTVIKLKSIVDSCERIIADPEIIETILPIASKTSNLLSLYKSESDYSYKRYMINCSQAGNSHRYVATVRQYPSKKIDIIKYIDFNKEDIGEQAKLYNEIMVFAKDQEAIEKLKNLTMIERNQLLKLKEEAKRREEIRLQEERRIAEDAATTHKIVHEAKRIIVLKDYLYHYCPRRGSITHTHTQKNKRDRLVSEMERVYDLISYGYPEQKLKNDLCGPAIGYLASIKDSNDELYEKAVSIVNKYERIPENMTKKQKIAMKVWRIDRRLFYLMSRIAGRMKAQS